MLADLATLETEEEIIWIKGYRSYHNQVQSFAWIGGYKVDDSWYWKGDKVDTPITTADWAPGHPDDVKNNTCLGLFHETQSGAFEFGDNDCDFAAGYICEKSAGEWELTRTQQTSFTI